MQAGVALELTTTHSRCPAVQQMPTYPLALPIQLPRLWQKPAQHLLKAGLVSHDQPPAAPTGQWSMPRAPLYQATSARIAGSCGYHCGPTGAATGEPATPLPACGSHMHVSRRECRPVYVPRREAWTGYIPAGYWSDGGLCRASGCSKTPTLWSAQLPVNPQMLQQRIRESNRTVLGSLALRDPQQVPLAVDVADPELAQLTDPQAAAVADLQHHVVLAVGASRQYPGDFRSGQQLRYALGLLRYRESHFQLIALEHLHQQKADGMKRLTTARCRELSLASQVLQVTTDLILIKPVRRLAIVLGQALNRLQIGLVGSRGKATHLHGGDHLLPKGCHRLFPHTVGGNRSLAPDRKDRRYHSAPRSGLVQRPHLRLVWSAAENQSDNMRLLNSASFYLFR